MILLFTETADSVLIPILAKKSEVCKSVFRFGTHETAVRRILGKTDQKPFPSAHSRCRSAVPLSAADTVKALFSSLVDTALSDMI